MGTDPAKVPTSLRRKGKPDAHRHPGRLGDRLRLNSPVTSVEWTEDGVVVDYEDENGPARIRVRRAVSPSPATWP
ncbi:FAD-dependent oxidoreductase [Amycolatopsis coloradensis]|nr:FAD-dependent oxidoreductase [Amycolatopsis coloradensis]